MLSTVGSLAYLLSRFSSFNAIELRKKAAFTRFNVQELLEQLKLKQSSDKLTKLSLIVPSHEKRDLFGPKRDLLSVQKGSYPTSSLHPALISITLFLRSCIFTHSFEISLQNAAPNHSPYRHPSHPQRRVDAQHPISSRQHRRLLNTQLHLRRQGHGQQRVRPRPRMQH